MDCPDILNDGNREAIEKFLRMGVESPTINPSYQHRGFEDVVKLRDAYREIFQSISDLVLETASVGDVVFNLKKQIVDKRELGMSEEDATMVGIMYSAPFYGGDADMIIAVSAMNIFQANNKADTFGEKERVYGLLISLPDWREYMEREDQERADYLSRRVVFL